MPKIEDYQTSTNVKRSIVIDGLKTSISLEDPFWFALKHIAGTQTKTLSQIVGDINGDRSEGNLSSAIRLHVLNWALQQANLSEVMTEMDHG